MPGKPQALFCDPSAGEIRLGALRFALVRPETLADLQKGIEDRLGAKASEFMYAAGASFGVGTARRLKAQAQDDHEQLAQLVCAHLSELGWGRWELTAIEADKQSLAVRVTNSPVARSYGQSDRPVCHLLAGCVAGMAEALFAMPTACTEITCLAAGEAECHFVATGHNVAETETWNW